MANREAERKARDLCDETSYMSIGTGEISRGKAMVYLGVENGMKLDEISGKLDAMSDAFNRLAAAIEDNNALIRAEQEERSRQVKKVKLGDSTP